jgi:putative ABC transport system permease protein
VDFTGQAFALRRDAGFVLGLGQLGPGPPELVDGQALRLPFQVKRAVAQPGDHGYPAPRTGPRTIGTVFQALGSFKSENGSLMLMQAFLYGISALVIVAFLTVWTVQRTRDIAVLKAMGASGSYVLRDAITQAALVLLAGAGLGGTVGVLGGFAAAQAAPFLVTPATTLLPVLGIVALGLAGAALAVRRVTTVDPLIALGGN